MGTASSKLTGSPQKIDTQSDREDREDMVPGYDHKPKPQGLTLSEIVCEITARVLSWNEPSHLWQKATASVSLLYTAAFALLQNSQSLQSSLLSISTKDWQEEIFTEVAAKFCLHWNLPVEQQSPEFCKCNLLGGIWFSCHGMLLMNDCWRGAFKSRFDSRSILCPRWKHSKYHKRFFGIFTLWLCFVPLSPKDFRLDRCNSRSYF